MTPVFGCLPLLRKIRIATVQDYNIKKKKKRKNKKREILAELCVFPTRTDLFKIVVSDANVQNVSGKSRSSMEIWLNFNTYF